MVIINLEFSEPTTGKQVIVGGQTFEDFDVDSVLSMSINEIIVSLIQSRINSLAIGSLRTRIDSFNFVKVGPGFALSTSSISAVATTPGG
ncbi:hypothetical protein [Microcystis aeruginosa]|uniref:Uncharacterized protein n=1 Tax=Microcystis aeruginosa NIES-3787 TaxID=2517782 RepID=A0A6H9GKT0_MICAE|nr:hypothetical protein [Microcystis aeruginosa]GCL46722.1 hypothetical protein NIES3787_24210 [Microcystis aeruginosa NIES-3787]